LYPGVLSSEEEKEKRRALTYISVRVTGVPTRKRANKKLKMSDVDPRGATYSADIHEVNRILQN
jgi:hypothetical protein